MALASALAVHVSGLGLGLDLGLLSLALTHLTLFNIPAFTTRHSNRKLALSTTFTQCAPETTKFSKITQNMGHFVVQGHSRSPILVPIESLRLSVKTKAKQVLNLSAVATLPWKIKKVKSKKLTRANQLGRLGRSQIYWTSSQSTTLGSGLFFTDNRLFTAAPPINSQNDRV